MIKITDIDGKEIIGETGDRFEITEHMTIFVNTRDHGAEIMRLEPGDILKVGEPDLTRAIKKL